MFALVAPVARGLVTNLAQQQRVLPLQLSLSGRTYATRQPSSFSAMRCLTIERTAVTRKCWVAAGRVTLNNKTPVRGSRGLIQGAANAPGFSPSQKQPQGTIRR